MFNLPLRYGYLFGALLPLILWVILFFHRRDLRREMLVMSFLLSFVGIIAEGIWCTADWVKPETITGTRVGFEDPILGFGAGGVTAVIYEEAFKHRVYKRLRKKTNHFLAFIMPWLLFWAVALITFWFLNFHSFSANMLGLITALVYIYVLRPDLVPDSLVTGLLVVLLSAPVYLLIFALFPGFKEAYWQWGKLSGLELAGIPIEDLLWLMGIGAFAGPFYEFWQGLRIVEKNN